MATSETQENTTSKQLTLFAADSLASLTVLPGSDEARKMTVTSGLNIAALLQNSDPVGLWLKMCLASEQPFSTRCYLTWKVWRTPRKRLLFRLAPSTPRTDESGSLFWRTPQAQEAGAKVETLYTKDGEPAKVGERAYRQQPDGRRVLQSVTLNQQVKMYPTPLPFDVMGVRTTKGKHRQNEHGLRKAAMWPTPGATAWHSTGNRAQVRENAETEEEYRKMTAGNFGQLNPEWVGWLMGFPPNWTDIGE